MRTHNRHNEFYRFHILKLGKLDFCNGCFANQFFLAILLPIYLFLLISGMSLFLKISLISFTLFNILTFGIMMVTGRKLLTRSSEIITLLYLFGAHLILLFGEINIDFSMNLILSLIFIFSLPQYSMYIWKILNSDEFKYPIIKLLIRLSFIHGYLFAVILTRYEPVIGLVAILFSSTLFITLRTFSSQDSNRKDELSSNPKKMNLVKATMNVSLAYNDDSCCEDCLNTSLCCASPLICGLSCGTCGC